MKFNATLTFNPPEQYAELTQAAEAAGWDTVNLGDGLFYFDETSVDYPYSDSGDRYWNAKTPFLDPFAGIAALGMVTEKIRVLRFSDVRAVDNRNVPHRWTLTPLDKPGHETVVVVNKMRYDLEIEDAVFTTRNLKRGRH